MDPSDPHALRVSKRPWVSPRLTTEYLGSTAVAGKTQTHEEDLNPGDPSSVNSVNPTGTAS
jgi:hypothetical protein